MTGGEFDAAEVGPYATAAGLYLAAGWPGVLPLPARRKEWPPKGYTGRDGLMPSAEQVAAWVIDKPDHNIGLRAPQRVLGIDVDDYGDKHGAEELSTLVDKLGPLPPTWVSTARDLPSGIQWLRVPQGRAWNDKPAAAIEIVQHGHRYGVVWPSVHPEGGVYRWIRPDGMPADDGQVPNVDDLPELPAEWVKFLSRGDLAEVSRAGLDAEAAEAWLSEHGGGEPCREMGRAVADARIGTANVHGSMTDLTQRIAYLITEGHCGGTAAIHEAHGAYKAALRARGDDPARRGDEFGRAVRGAIDKVAAKAVTPWDPCQPGYEMAMLTGGPTEPPRGEPEQAQDGTTASPAHLAMVDSFVAKLRAQREARRIVAEDDADEVVIPPVIDLGEFLAEPDPPVIYRIDRLMPTGSRVLLTAGHKAGKSSMLGNLIRALVDGGKFLSEFDVSPVRRVVLIDNELDPRTLRRWLRAYGIVNVGAVSVVSLRGKVGAFNILDPETRARWAAAIGPADVLILDCLRPVLDALGLDEHRDGGRFVVALDALLAEAGIGEGLLSHHTGHVGERARGDSRLQDWPDVLWRIVRDGADEGQEDPLAVRYLTAYGRDVAVPEMQLGFEPLTRTMTVTGAGSRQQVKADGALAALLTAMRNYTGADPLSANRIETQLMLGSGYGRQAIRDALSHGVAHGRIDARQGPRNAIFYSPSADAEGLR
jgi:hypothetical protein